MSETPNGATAARRRTADTDHGRSGRARRHPVEPDHRHPGDAVRLPDQRRRNVFTIGNNRDADTIVVVALPQQTAPPKSTTTTTTAAAAVLGILALGAVLVVSCGGLRIVAWGSRRRRR